MLKSSSKFADGTANSRSKVWLALHYTFFLLEQSRAVLSGSRSNRRVNRRIRKLSNSVTVALIHFLRHADYSAPGPSIIKTLLRSWHNAWGSNNRPRRWRPKATLSTDPGAGGELRNSGIGMPRWSSCRVTYSGNW